jgi:2-dehydro-3-deoxyphosphogluconate aldolase/(4S)-4-hydroxy-2-oxoglutarate aldolase
MMNLRNILALSPVLPVIVLQHVEDALPLAEALFAGGIRIIEITLRTPAAFEAIERITRVLPDMIVGVGTVLNSFQLLKARDAGAVFAVSPGLSAELLATAHEHAIPYLPGVANASDIMQALNAGVDIVKPFPIELLGGIAWLKTHANVFPHLHFCPSGGITPENKKSYLNLESVLAVGGSWLAPMNLIQSKNWKEIMLLAQKASFPK